MFASSQFVLKHTLTRHNKHVQVSFGFASLTQAHEGEVEGVAFDVHHGRIATVGGGCLILT